MRRVCKPALLLGDAALTYEPRALGAQVSNCALGYQHEVVEADVLWRGRVDRCNLRPQFGGASLEESDALVEGTRQLPPFLARTQIANSDSSARGINDAGVIVGFTGRPDGTNVGFVGSDTRGFQLLIPLGGDAPGVSVLCSGINNFRHVVCGVTDALGNNRAFIGTPDE